MKPQKVSMAHFAVLSSAAVVVLVGGLIVGTYLFILHGMESAMEEKSL